MSFPQPAETGKLRVLLRVLSLALAVADIICIVELWMIVGWVYIVIVREMSSRGPSKSLYTVESIKS